MPKRIQRKREKDWRMTPGTVYVGRSGRGIGRYGNPFRVGGYWVGDEDFLVHHGIDLKGYVTADNCLPAFETYALKRLQTESDWLEPLRGKDLACWCKEGAPCHADVLLRLANA